MEALLLVLVLSAGDPGSASVAQAVAEALRAQDPRARIVLAPEAARLLADRGVRDADLVERSERVLVATAKDLRLVVVRVERREAGGDQIIDVDLWSGGRRDGMSAVAGRGDPLSQATEGARRLLREATHDPVDAAERADRQLLAAFVDRGDWMGLIADVDARGAAASPRLRHAAIMARLRLGDRDGAQTALAALRAAAPAHALTAEAATAVTADAGGADALRDAAAPDDGTNTLK